MPNTPPPTSATWEHTSLVENVFRRVYTLLPIESNLSLVEVEESQLFHNLRKSLVSLCTSDILMEAILQRFLAKLDKINQHDNYLVLRQRSIASLSSLLMVLRLLSDLMKVNWDLKDSAVRKKSVESSHSAQSMSGSFSIGFGSASVDYHTSPPGHLDCKTVVKAVLMVSRLKSTTTLTHELALINGRPLPPVPIYEDMAVRPLLDQIDLNCEAILRFLGASNTRDFYEFTVSKLSVLKHNIGNDSEFAPYLELFSAVYLNEQWCYEYLRHLRAIMSSVKKPVYRQLVLSFFTRALNIWVNSRPHEFLNCAREDSKAAIEAEGLFEEMLNTGDGSLSRGSSSSGAGKQFRTHFKFFGTLLALNPKAVSTLLHGGSSSRNNPLKKLTQNKKQRLLSNMTKVLEQQSSKDAADNATVLESLDFFVALAQVASSVYSYDPQSIVVLYTKQNYELMSRALVPINVSKSSPVLHEPTAMELDLLDRMRMDYFTGMCIIDSKKFIPTFVLILNDPSAALETLNITCSILKQFSVTPAWLGTHQDDLLSMLPALRKIMVRVGYLVKANSYTALSDDDETSSLGKTSSTSSSEFHQYRSMIGHEAKLADSLRTNSTPSSLASTATPKTERLKDTAKTLLKNHHSSSHTTTRSSVEEKSLTDGRISLLSRQVLGNALEIFKKSPEAFFFTNQESVNDDSIGNLIQSAQLHVEPLIVGLKDNNSRLVLSGRQFLQSFISVTNIPDTLESVVSCYTGSALICTALAKLILSFSASENMRKDIMEYLVKSLEYRTSLYTILEHHSYFKTAIDYERLYYTQIMSPIDQALLLVLCTPNVETYGLTKRGFSALAQELNKSLSPEVIRSNLDFYAAVSNDSVFTTGTVALQKNIRKFFLKLQDPTPSVVEAFLGIYDKWYQFAKSDHSELTQTELSNFRNFAGFLAAISGLFVDEEISDKPWFMQETRLDINQKIEQFIDQQLSMLGDDGLVTRENAREILASECNPKTYPKIIQALVPLVNELAKRYNALKERDFTIMEHLIALIKAVLSKGNDLDIFGFSVELLHSIDQLAVIVDSKGNSDTTMLKLRIRMSTLFSELEKCRDKLVIASAFKLRNKFLRYVYNWFDQAVSYTLDGKTQMAKTSLSKDWEYLYIDVAMECAKSLSLLLNDLVLEAQQVLNMRELQYSKSSLFSIYFNTFLKALELYSASEEYPVSMRHKVNTISEYIVVCLTNLLKSNVDVGLQYALPIGYHTNHAIRVSFLKVFVSIVETYSPAEIENTPEDKRRMLSRIARLMLENPKLMNALGNAVPSSEASSFAFYSLSLAASLNQSANVIAYLVNEEITLANSYSDILRRNSFASRSLAAFGRSVGLENLVSTLRPILTEIRDSEADFEIEKLDIDDPDAEQNLNNFMHYLKKLVNVIIGSIDRIPLEFRYVCKKMSEAVDRKFSNSRLIAVGSFIFLRYYCPAIVSPEAEKIVKVPNPQTQRKYLLLTKVLQNMANGTILSLKWPLLKKRMEELTELNDKVNDFLDKMTQIDDDLSFEVVEPQHIDESDYNFFHTFMYANWSLFRQQFVTSASNTSEMQYFKDIAKKIDVFLKMAGQPTTMFGYELPPSITPESNIELYEFMNKHSNTELGDLLDSSFVYQGFSQNGQHLLVFSYAEYGKVKDYDQELLLYRIIQVASKLWDTKFVFVLDCTGNDGSVLFPRQMMKVFGDFAPQLVSDNCMGVTYYNISSGFYPKLIHALKANLSFEHIPSHRFSFISGTADRKSIMNLGLSNQAMHAYSDVRVKFTDASLFQQDQGRFTPVILRIGNEFLQLSQTTPQRVIIRGELKEIYLNDVYHLKQIENVSATETTSVPNEITISFTNGKKIVLASPKFLEIMRLLYFTQSRVLSTSDNEWSGGEIQKTAEDLMGQLFNVIFLGLTSSSEEVRSISYNLLSVAQKRFKLDFGREIAQFPEVFFPKDNSPFVSKLSEKLAVTSPQITPELITSFFDVYDSTGTSRQRLAAILYVSPWVSNIYDQIYCSNAERGREIVSKIISNFLAIAIKDSHFLNAFNIAIFKKLCLEDRLSDILVDEVVSNAIDRQAEGSDWKNSISFLTCFPTVAIAGYVVKKLRETTSIPFPNSNGKYSVEAHTSWTQIAVLIHICVSLFFDSLQLTEMFLADIFHIVTVLLDVGPLDVRVGCHKLLLNVLQNFLSKTSIPEMTREVIHKNVENLTSHRSRLLFGLNRESPDSFETETSKFSTRISTLESLVASLMEVIHIAGTPEDKSVWISRWNIYVVSAMNKQDPALKGRAIMLAGILSKGGIEDTLVRALVGYIAEVCTEELTDAKSVYLAISTIYALNNMTEGLLASSKLFTEFFWLAMLISHSNLSAIFQGGLKFLTRCLDDMSVKEKFIDYDTVGTLMGDKHIFGDMVDEIEKADGYVMNADNFDQALLHITSRGLQLQYAKATATDCLMSLFKSRLMNESLRGEIVGYMNSAPLCYLLFLSFLLNPRDLEQVLDDIDLADEFHNLNEQLHLPKILADFLLSDSDISNLTLIQAAIYFNEGEPNEKTVLRLMIIFKFVGLRAPHVLLKMYHIIKQSLRMMIASSTLTNDILSEVLELASIAIVMPEYHQEEEMKAAVDSLLSKYQLTGVRNYKFGVDGIPKGSLKIKQALLCICQEE